MPARVHAELLLGGTAAATVCPLVETPGGHRDPIDPSSVAWAAAWHWLGPAA